MNIQPSVSVQGSLSLPSCLVRRLSSLIVRVGNFLDAIAMKQSTAPVLPVCEQRLNRKRVPFTV